MKFLIDTLDAEVVAVRSKMFYKLCSGNIQCLLPYTRQIRRVSLALMRSIYIRPLQRRDRDLWQTVGPPKAVSGETVFPLPALESISWAFDKTP